MSLEQLLTFIESDAVAITYQSMAQYRKEIAKQVKEAITESRTFNEHYRTAGEAAKDLDVAVGTIGCPHCGTTSIGAIWSHICDTCEKSYFHNTNEKSYLE